MPVAVRWALIGLSITLLVVGMYHRIRAARSGDRFDRSKEGWATMIGTEARGSGDIRISCGVALEPSAVRMGYISTS